MLPARITLAHFSISSAISFAYSAGEPGWPVSQLLWPRPTSHARVSSATVPRLPDADRRTRERTQPTASHEISQLPTRSFCACVLLDPGGTAMPRMTALHMLLDHNHSLRSREFIISWLNHTPHATAVYASCSALPRPHATLPCVAGVGRLPAFGMGRTHFANSEPFGQRPDGSLNRGFKIQRVSAVGWNMRWQTIWARFFSRSQVTATIAVELRFTLASPA